MNSFAARSVFAFRRLSQSCLFLVTALMTCPAAMNAMSTSDTLIVREALGITLPRRTVSNIILSTPADAWFAGHRTDVPHEGEPVHCADGSEVKWQRIATDSTGWFPGEPPGERFVAVVLDRTVPGRMILEGMGHDIVYVNGTPRSGNPYQQKDNPDQWEPRFDYSRIPIDLNKGSNLLMFRYSRGRFKIRLVSVTTPVGFNAKDVTMPDAVAGNNLDAWGSVALSNATGASLKGCWMICLPPGGKPDTSSVPMVPAMGLRKAAFRIRLQAHVEKGILPVHLVLLGGGRPGHVIDTVTVPLRVVGSEDPRKETFVSAIDGSVQYYAVTPPPPDGFKDRPALFLSLHGAGVEAINQAASYEPKRWGYVVAPTNRRPYGFSWEDWGRLDALEVLEIAKNEFNIDEGRVYLTGHSMGGHGTWFMGATYPDKFGAIGPSAGWITFHSYRFTNAQEETSQVKRMLRRAEAPSDLFSLVDNYRHFGVYIIHGAIDDNVLPEQSYMMLERLKPIHKDYVFYEQPGAGHWWDNSPEPGSDCVDWRPLFDFFGRHVRPGMERTRTVEFTTANPGISSRDSWLSIDAQERQLALSTVRVHLDPGMNQVQGTTVNVARLSIDTGVLRARSMVTVELDSQKIQIHPEDIRGSAIWVGKEKGRWAQVNAPSAAEKNARRCGTFKEVFRNKMALVYGTAGTAQENIWAFERARFDAEKLWYQGNASVDVLADTEFVPAADPDRNVVIYGNSQTHRLWKALLPDCPVSVDRDKVVLGGESVKRKDICCIFTRPRSGSAVASIGVVSGTGIDGLRLSHLVTYLEPGLGLPDLTAFNEDVLTKGDAGIILSGFFGPDWSMKSGEFVSGQR
jgi:dienelactone hydrolase